MDLPQTPKKTFLKIAQERHLDLNRLLREYALGTDVQSFTQVEQSDTDNAAPCLPDEEE